MHGTPVAKFYPTLKEMRPGLLIWEWKMHLSIGMEELIKMLKLFMERVTNVLVNNGNHLFLHDIHQKSFIRRKLFSSKHE